MRKPALGAGQAAAGKAAASAPAAAKGGKKPKAVKGTVVGDVQKREQAVRNAAAAAKERAGTLLTCRHTSKVFCVYASTLIRLGSSVIICMPTLCVARA